MQLSRHVLVATLFWACLAVQPVAVSGTADVPVLTLADAVREALTQSDRMLNELDGVELASLGVRLARNDFQPKLVPNVQGSFGQTNVSNQTYRLDLSQRFITGTEVRMGVGASTAQIPGAARGDDIRFYNADTTLTLSQPLLRGFGPGAARRGLGAAEVRRDQAVRQRTIAEQAIVVEVAEAYYRIVAQQSLVEAARTSLERSRRLREASEAKLDAGLVSQLDVFRAQQLVSQAEVQYLDAQSAVEDARDQLRLIIGRDSDAPFDVVRDIPRNLESVTVDAAVATTLARRPELEIARVDAADAERAASYTRNQLLPQVDVNLALTRRATAQDFRSSFGVDRFQLATFFTISMPVDRTPQLVAYQTALIDRDRRQRQFDRLRQQLTGETRRAVRNLERVIRNLAAAEVNVGIGRREVEVAQLRYDRGLSNNLEVVNAEANLLSTDGRRILALADLAVAQLALRATIGILDPQQDILAPAVPPPGVGATP